MNKRNILLVVLGVAINFLFFNVSISAEEVTDVILESYDISTEKNVLESEYLNSNNIENDANYKEEDQLNIINDIQRYINKESNNLLNNSYYIYIKNTVNDLKHNHQNSLLNNKYLNNDDLLKNKDFIFLLNNNLTLDEFSEIDKEILNSNRDRYKLKREISVFRELMNNSKNYYIETGTGAKLYPSFIARTNNNFHTAIKNRESILSGNYKGYNTNNFYSRVNGDKGKLIDRPLHDNELMLNFFINLEIYKHIDLNPILLDDLEVYMGPFELNDVLGYTYLGSRTEKGPFESIYIFNPMKDGKLTDALINNVKNTSLHELGHAIEGRSKFKSLNYDIFNKYKSNTFKVKNNYQKEIPYSNISGHELKELDTTWSQSLTENFAEDFKMFMSKRLPKHLAYDVRYKKTIYIYESKLDNLFKNILKK